MKKPINEIAKLKRLAGLITESEYQEEMMNTEAKSSVSKEDKIQVIKEWIWFTCDEGQAKDDINKYNKMIDIYFASKDDVTKEDFKNLWNKVSEVWGVGDVGADSEGFPETWRDVQRGKLVNPSMKYEGKVKEGLPVEDPRVEQIIQTLKDLDVDGETMEYIIKSVGMDDQMANQLVHNKAEYQSSQMNENTSKMDELKEYLKELKDEGVIHNDVSNHIIYLVKQIIKKEIF